MAETLGRSSLRVRLAKFLLLHKKLCIALTAVLLIFVTLTALRPPMTQLEGSISPEFQAESGSKYSEASVNLLVIGAARGRNVKTAVTETYIGFAGMILPADIDPALKSEVQALEAALEVAQTSVDQKNRNYKASRNPADKPTAADLAALEEAKATYKAAKKEPEMKAKLKLYRKQSFLSSTADIALWIPQLLEGSKVTISLTILSVIAGLFLSIFFALGKISKFRPLRAICSAYIFFFRGTPLLMQLLVIYHGLPMLDKRLAINDPFTTAAIAFSLNSAAYCAEIIRAAIQSIEKGQFEASHALGFTNWQTMRLIIIPQSFRRLIPPVANEFIMVLKDASLVTMIGLADLTQTTFKISNSNATMTVYFPALLLYLLITALFTYIFNRLEKRFSIHL